MDNKLTVKNGQGRVLGDFTIIVSALVPQANHTGLCILLSLKLLCSVVTGHSDYFLIQE